MTMSRRPIPEPKDIDLTIEGGAFSAADLKALRAQLANAQEELAHIQARAESRPWIDEPAPTLQQLVAKQRKQLEEEEQKRVQGISDGPGISDIDTSGIGGKPTPEESAYISAYLWTTRPQRGYTRQIRSTVGLAHEPAPEYKATSGSKNKRKKQ